MSTRKDVVAEDYAAFNRRDPVGQLVSRRHSHTTAPDPGWRHSATGRSFEAPYLRDSN